MYTREISLHINKLLRSKYLNGIHHYSNHIVVEEVEWESMSLYHGEEVECESLLNSYLMKGLMMVWLKGVMMGWLKGVMMGWLRW